MKIDPFVLCPHLNDFFTGCDTDADNLADPRDMSCIFRSTSAPGDATALDRALTPRVAVLTAPQSGIDINLAYMFDAYSEIKDGRNVTHRNNILKIIATSAVEDEEAAQLLRLSEPLLDRIGQPLPLFVDKEDFVRALEVRCSHTSRALCSRIDAYLRNNAAVQGAEGRTARDAPATAGRRRADARPV